MPNEQLVAYIKQQTQKEISSGNIKAELLKVGWPAADVEEALKAVPGGAVPVTAPVSVSPVAPGTASKEPMKEPTKEPAEESVQKPVVIEKKPETIDIQKIIDVSAFDGASFENPTGMKKPATQESKQEDDVKKPKEPLLPSSFGKFLPEIVMGAVIVALAAAVVIFYLKTGSLNGSVASLTSENSGLTAQIAVLSKSKTDLQSQINSLEADNHDLNNQLSIFSASTSTATSGVSEAAVSLKGALGTVKGQYTLTTNKNIVIYVKNYKDAKVSAALQPLLGSTSTVELFGTHLPGSNVMTVEGVNGATIQ